MQSTYPVSSAAATANGVEAIVREWGTRIGLRLRTVAAYGAAYARSLRATRDWRRPRR